MFTKKVTNEILFGGDKYEVDTSFDNVLLFFELMDDDVFENHEKIFIANELFVGELDKDFEYQLELFKTILKQKLEIDLDNKEQPKEMVYDFEQDAELIYASFLTEYGIDLIDQKGQLSWNKFLYLLRQLSDKSPFKKAVGYRLAKVPAENKHNREQVRELKRMKAFYALKKEPVNNDSKLDAAFAAFKR